MHPRWNDIYTILLLLFACTLFPDSARCQTESFEALPSLPSPVEDTFRIPAGGSFDISTLPPGTFERDARGEDSAEQDATGSSPQPQIQTQQSDHHGLVMRSVKRTLEDQKELYRAPFKPSNFKWDALVLGGTAALLATDRHIEKHIGNAHYTFYQATSDVAIAGLGAAVGGVWIWGIKGDHPHAKETGVLELETLVEHIPDLHTDAVTGGTATPRRRKREWRFLEAPQHQHFISRWTRHVHLRDGDGSVTRISAKVGAGAGLLGSDYRDGHPVHGPGSLVVGHV